MTTATITSKGQITIPANVRQALSVGPGDRVEFVQLEPGQFLFIAANRLDQTEHVVRALRVYSAGNADFADCLIERTAAAAGCALTMTFDVGASKSAGMTLVH